MTEEEAKTKWCPQTRSTVAISAAGEVIYEANRDPPHHNKVNCIGSACAVWRWLPLMADEAFKNAVLRAAIDINDTTENKHKAAKFVTENRARYGLPVVPFDGFCGLAGKP